MNCSITDSIDISNFHLFIFVLFSFYFRVCTGYANCAYIKCSTKFLSSIALIHMSGDFFAGKRGQCVGTERVC